MSFILPAIMAASAGANLLGNFLNQPDTQSPTNINPYTASVYDLLSGNLSNYQKQMNSALGTQGGYLQQSGNLYGDIANFTPTSSYDPSAALRQFLGQTNIYQNLAKDITQGGADQAAINAKTAANTAARQAAQQFGSLGALNTGAASKAIASGAAEAALPYQQQAAQNYSNVLANLYNQGLQYSNQGQQFLSQLQQAQDAQTLQALQAAASGYGQVGAQYGNQASLYGNMANQALSGLASYGAPEYYQQPIIQQQNPWQTLLQGASQAGSIYAGLQGAGIIGNNAVQPSTFSYTAPNAVSMANYSGNLLGTYDPYAYQ